MKQADAAALPTYRPRRATLRDGRQVLIRAVRPDDAGEIQQAFDRMSSASRYMRFMQHKRELDPERLQHGVHPVAGREFVLVATIPAADGIDIVGAVRYVAAPDRDTCEFAVTVADDWQRVGLAATLMRSLIRRAARDGYRSIEGLVLRDNQGMLDLAHRLGFQVKFEPGDGSLRRVVRRLAQPAPR
ncbi:MAG: GNAT family N-acetyltransferase [Variovorax sp.]|jgi:RimJ/RimL family protein N-acetyltransferase